MDFDMLSLLITLITFESVYGVINNPQNIRQLCEGKSDVSFPYPSDCTRFIECDLGKSVIKSCGPGTVYNPVHRVCDWPYSVPECSGTLGDENYSQENISLSPTNLQNAGNQQFNQLSELNNKQNNQAINNEHQPITNEQHYSQIQNGDQNINVKPNFVPTENIEKLNNLVAYKPPQQNQSKWDDRNNYLTFGYYPESTNNNRAYPLRQSLNQPNGRGDLGIQEQNNYIANGGNKLVNEQQTQDQQQPSKNRNSPVTLLKYKQNGPQFYKPLREGSYDKSKNHIQSDTNQNSPLSSNTNQNGHGYGQNLHNQDDKQNNQFNQNKDQNTKNNNNYENNIDIRVKKKNEQWPAWTGFNN